MWFEVCKPSSAGWHRKNGTVSPTSANSRVFRRCRKMRRKNVAPDHLRRSFEHWAMNLDVFRKRQLNPRFPAYWRVLDWWMFFSRGDSTWRTSFLLKFKTTLMVGDLVLSHSSSKIFHINHFPREIELARYYELFIWFCPYVLHNNCQLRVTVASPIKNGPKLFRKVLSAERQVKCERRKLENLDAGYNCVMISTLHVVSEEVRR